MDRTFSGENLGAFYRSKGLAVGDFRCRYQTSCLSCVPEGTRHGAEAYVGARYGDPFRIVLVSADLGDDVRPATDLALQPRFVIPSN